MRIVFIAVGIMISVIGWAGIPDDVSTWASFLGDYGEAIRVLLVLAGVVLIFMFVTPVHKRLPSFSAGVSREVYEREKQHADRWYELLRDTVEGPVTVDQPSPGTLRIGPPQTQDFAAGLTFEGSLDHELKRQGEATAQTEDGQRHELAASLGGEGSVKGDLEQTHVDATASAEQDASATGTDPEAERRAEKVARADQLAAEGQFVLDRIRAGMEQHRQHGEDWLVDAYAFFQEHDYPPEVDVPKPQLPLARSRRYPAWARQMATEIDRLLVLLRATANRRYIRVHEVLRATDDASE